MTTAIKPTRRELLKTLLGAAEERARVEMDATSAEIKRLVGEREKLNKQVRTCVETYLKNKHRSTLAKINRLLASEFPGQQLEFFVNIEEDRTHNYRRDYISPFKPDGRITSRLTFNGSAPEAPVTDIPDGVMEQMVATRKKVDEMTVTIDALQRNFDKQNETVYRWSHGDHTTLFTKLVRDLGDEAVPHLDALIDMIEKIAVQPT